MNILIKVILLLPFLISASLAEDELPPTPSVSIHAMPYYTDPTPTPMVKETEKYSRRKTTRRIMVYRERIDKARERGDLFDIEELPAGQSYVETGRGWKAEQTGKIYDRKWLEEKRALEKKS